MRKRKSENKPEPMVGEAITEELTKQDLAERAAEDARDFPPPPPQKVGLFSKEELKENFAQQLEAQAIVDELTEQFKNQKRLFDLESVAAEHATLAKTNGYSAEASELKAISQILAKLKKGRNYLVKEAKTV